MGGGKTQQSTSQVSVPPDVLARYNSVNATAQNVAQTPFQQYSTDPNAFVAPLNSTQQAGIAGTNQYANSAQPYYQAAAGLTAAGAGAANPTSLDSNAINQYMSPYIGDVAATTSALQNQQNQQALSGQLGNAISNNAFGGDRAGVAAANTQQQLSLSNASTLSNLFNTGYNNALSTAQQQQGVGLGAAQQNLARLTGAGSQLANIGAGAQTAGLAGAQAQLTAGQAQQQTQQAGQTALYNQFLQQQSYPFQTAQFLANIAEGTGALSGSTTTSTQPAPFFSDARLKEDIEPIGKTYDGSTIVKFRYKGHQQKQIGLIAQDVERNHPEAVGLAGGYKTVDYDAATKHAAEIGKGLHPNSMGGQVVDIKDYAKRPNYRAGGLVPKAYAYGGYGYNSVDNYNDMMNQMYGLAPWANSGPANGSGETPYAAKGKGVVPASKLPVGQLMTARAPTQNSGTPMQEINQALNTTNGLAKMGHNGYDAIQSWQQKQGQGTPAVQSSATPSNNTGAGGDSPDIGAGPPAEVYGLARGGLAYRHRDLGGQLSDEADEPYVAGTGEKGLAIPDDRNKHTLATAQNPSSSSQSGIGALGTDVGVANGLWQLGSDIAPFLLNRGGLAGYKHRDDGGGIDDGHGDGPPDVMSPEQLDAKYQAQNPPANDVGQAIPQSGLASVVHAIAGNETGGVADEDRAALMKGMTGRGLAPGNAKATDTPITDSPGLTAPRGKGLAVDTPNLKNAPTPGGEDSPPASAPAQQPSSGLAPSQPVKASESTPLPNPNNAIGGGKDGVSGWMRDNQHLWVPLLSGLGAMASSNSRYLGSAILQGAGAGAASYENTQNNMADRAHEVAGTQNTEEATRAQQIENAKKFLVSNRNGMPTGVITSGGVKGLDEVAPGERAIIPGSDVTSGPPGQPNTQAPGVGAPPPPAPPPPKHVDIPGIDPQTIAAAQAAKKSYFRPMTSDDDINTTTEYRGRVNAGVAQATADSQPINDMVSTTAHALATGQTGALGSQRAEVGKYLNLLAREAGYGDNYFSDAAGSGEVLAKIATMRAGASAGIAGQHAVEALQQFRNANPDIDHDPKANANIAALAMTQRQAMLDQAKHADDFQSLSGGSLRGAEADFSRRNGQYRNEANTLQTIMAQHPEHMEKLLSGQMTPEQIDKYFSAVAPGLKNMSRYFPTRQP